ncbi:hypothetical protein [Ideonella sp.]|uniref:hypothetical protein n=1 Tax=Ideonella sp. TaxID=1929293 RepID=UPI0035B1FB35
MSRPAAVLALLALALAGDLRAQPAPEAAPAPTASRAPEPQVIHQITEDDQVRIEELRVRGQTRRLSVQPKIRGVAPYEIAVPEPGRAPDDDPKAGKRVWLSLTF